MDLVRSFMSAPSAPRWRTASAARRTAGRTSGWQAFPRSAGKAGRCRSRAAPWPAWACQHHHLARQEHRLGNGVGDEHDRLAGLAPDALQLHHHGLARHRVERGERLVHQQQAGVVDQARAMPTRCCMPPERFVRIMLLELLQPHGLEQGMRARGARRDVHAHGADRQQHIVQHVLPGQQGGVLEHDADVAPRAVDGLSAQLGHAGRWFEQGGGHLEQGGLAAARGGPVWTGIASGDRGAESLERRGRAARGPVGHLQALDAEDRCAAIVLCLGFTLPAPSP